MVKDHGIIIHIDALCSAEVEGCTFLFWWGEGGFIFRDQRPKGKFTFLNFEAGLVRLRYELAANSCSVLYCTRTVVLYLTTAP
jgi:hypothetical protein